MAKDDDYDEDDALFLAAMHDFEVRAEPGKPEPAPLPVDDDAEDALFLRAMQEPSKEASSRPSSASAPPERKPTVSERLAALAERDDEEVFLEAMNELQIDPQQIAHDKDRREKFTTPSGLMRLKAAKKPIREIEETLDLHGLTVEQAMHSLSRFVASARKRGKKRVIVITGKGQHSEGGVGKIRKAAEQWIQRRGKTSIESYAPAPRAQGGRGAFVLVLRPND